MNASIDSGRLIDRIYEAGQVPTLWPALLGELGAAVGGNGGFLFATQARVNSVEHHQKDGWSERDPNLPRAIALNHAASSLTKTFSRMRRSRPTRSIATFTASTASATGPGACST